MSAINGKITGFALICLALSVVFLSGGFASVTEQPKDQSPVVKITAPQNNGTYNWNTLVDYSIVATDHGKSTKYQEIPSKQVLLKTTYAPDVSKVPANSGKTAEPAGLTDIVDSNCMGCHAFKSKAMGPSFSAIAKRYPHSEAKIDALSQSIRNGTMGIWGQAAMPPHPELTGAELHDISRWILNDAADPNVNYYVGAEGSFQMQSLGKPDPNAGIILTASYVDQGTNERGEDTIVIHGK